MSFPELDDNNLIISWGAEGKLGVKVPWGMTGIRREKEIEGHSRVKMVHLEWWEWKKIKIMKGHVAAVDRQESRVWKESRDLKEKSWIVQCHRLETVCVEKDDSRDSGKIKEREYQQNLQFIPYITIIRNFSAFMDRFFLVVFLWLLFQPICIYYFSPEIHFCSRIF